MGQITKNQELFLQKRGVATQGMTFEAASALISQLKNPVEKPHQPLNNAYAGFQQEKPKSYSRFDSQSAYTSYAKDLCIAMLEAHVEARKLDNKIEPIAIADLMEAAVDAIQKAKGSFDNGI